MWRHIPCRRCEPPVWKRQPTTGPKGRHAEIVSALRALNIGSQRLPVAYATGKGCIVPLGLRNQRLFILSAETITLCVCACCAISKAYVSRETTICS